MDFACMQGRHGVLDRRDDVRALSLDTVPTRPEHATAVLVEPDFFDRTYAINPHMGGEVDREQARRQWEQLRETYERHVEDVRVLDPAELWEGFGEDTDVAPPEDQPDMVFVANHAMPTAEGDDLVLARMAVAERESEPAYFEAWARGQGYSVQPAPAARFEGAGDAIWHPGRRLVWGGYGIRTDREAYDELADRLDVAVVPLELDDERYFHLDLCLLPLSEREALVQPEAFTEAALAKLEAGFERLIEAPPEESLDSFAVNGEVVDDTVIAGSGAPQTATLLADAGYDVVTVDTGEFLKAGGSVSCLTLWLGDPR